MCIFSGQRKCLQMINAVLLLKQPQCSEGSESRTKNEERRRTCKRKNVSIPSFLLLSLSHAFNWFKIYMSSLFLYFCIYKMQIQEDLFSKARETKEVASAGDDLDSLLPQ